MGIPVVREGPCGCPLRSVSIFIAWFYMVLLSLALIVIVFVGINNVQYYVEQPEGTAETAKQFAEIIGYVTFAIVAILMVFTILLLYGLYKENTCLIFTYVCIKGSFIVLTLLGVVQILIQGRFVKENALSVVFTVVDAVFIYLLYCYYRLIKDFPSSRMYSNEGYPSSGFKA